jgi:hypothetical protein
LLREVQKITIADLSLIEGGGERVYVASPLILSPLLRREGGLQKIAESANNRKKKCYFKLIFN